ncbi:hypothetical protein F5878DRAFT_181648 [Lentinula raphanica]|uniref:Fatty acid synthase meander beta sheet domain-containing protein n=1 Tax=Lentinula raphanica TaxID=153919 RepID=A0AA38P8C9_9AGAR|nr:hypothetical protein F5878DRAFT_181648 [Lentinula raphanica]
MILFLALNCSSKLTLWVPDNFSLPTPQVTSWPSIKGVVRSQFLSFLFSALFEVSFKKDSLWAVEDVETVFDQDPERKSLPTNPAWLSCIGGSDLNWLGALIRFTSVVQGSSYISNPIRCLFYPCRHKTVVVNLSNGQPTSITVYGRACSYDTHDPSFKATEIVFNSSTNLIDITIFEERR